MQIRKLQLVQLLILKDIDLICKKYNLKYYLIGGTLLGAIRHKGFIPWDDDIDIVMYRGDMEKLIKIIHEEYFEKYFVQNFKTDPYYTRYITKIRLNNTLQIEEALGNAKSHQGIYIDIFPLDFVKKNKGFSMKIRGVILRLLFAIKSLKNNIFYTKNKIKILLGKILRIFTFLIPNGLINYLFDYVCSKDNNKQCNFTSNFSSHFKWEKQTYENDVYGEGVQVEFENNYFIAPTQYDVILKRIYGDDYMELPPKSKRITHQLIEIDFGPYINCVENEVRNYE